MRSRSMRFVTTAATRPAMFWPTWRSRSGATTSGRKLRNFSLVADDQLLQAQPLRLALHQGRAGFAKFDRAGHHTRIERGIVGAKLLHRTRTANTAGDSCRQNLEMERLGDHVVSAGQEPIHRATVVAPARNQDHGRIL